MKEFDPGLLEKIEALAFFIPWDLERNMPRVTVDTRGVLLERQEKKVNNGTAPRI